jgi:hypothetical protein
MDLAAASTHETKPETKPETAPETKTETESETKPKPESKSKPKPEPEWDDTKTLMSLSEFSSRMKMDKIEFLKPGEKVPKYDLEVIHTSKEGRYEVSYVMREKALPLIKENDKLAPNFGNTSKRSSGLLQMERTVAQMSNDIKRIMEHLGIRE